MNRPIRNIAIIAHVDHGKTTLVDCLLKQSGTFAAHERLGERIMDSNDIERERGSRPGWVVDQTFDLFDRLGASDAQLDFTVIYASALQGWASTDYTERRPDMAALFEAILAHVPPPAALPGLPLQLQISTLDY